MQIGISSTLLVYEDSRRVIGFAGNTRFRPKASYNSSTETSVYFDSEVNANGRESDPYQSLFESIEATDLHRDYAVITLPNSAPVKLHEKSGFDLVGIFHEIGGKFGQYDSVAMYQKSLSDIIAIPKF